MYIAIIIGIFVFMFFMDLPYMFMEKKKLSLLSVYLFFCLSGAIISILLAINHAPRSPSSVITAVTNFVLGRK